MGGCRRHILRIAKHIRQTGKDGFCAKRICVPKGGPIGQVIRACPPTWTLQAHAQRLANADAVSVLTDQCRVLTDQEMIPSRVVAIFQ